VADDIVKENSIKHGACIYIHIYIFIQVWWEFTALLLGMEGAAQQKRDGWINYLSHFLRLTAPGFRRVGRRE